MADPTILPALEHLAFSEGLAPEQRARLAEVATPVVWEAGATVFREGERDALLYLVETGRVAIELTVPGRGPLTILTVEPGEVFGWSSLFARRPKSAAARTLEPTRAFALDADHLRRLCDEDPKLGYDITRRILQVVAERLTATRMQLLDMFGEAAPTSTS